MLKKSILTAVLITATVAAAHAAPTHIDAKIAKYKSTAGVAGNLSSIGSDTLNNLMTYWAEGFKKKYPNVNIQIEGKGSTTAPPALIAGTAQLGPMSREMKSSEIEGFEKKYGYKPTKIGVALDSLAVFVNKDNPIKSLSLDEVDAIFSSTHKRGLSDITTWGQLGVTGKLAAKPISLYGRNSASGTYGYFKEHTLKKGDYKSSVKEQPGSASVVEGIAHDISGIGYSGIGYATSGVRVLALSDKKGAPAEAANYQNVLSGKYPLSRMLYIYVAKKPGEPLPKVVEEFLKYALSKEGQEIVVKDGYDPLTAKMIDAQLKSLK
ncbi:MAG: PstS family phosphate ABC transporter substrate-binding protein [Desulfuromonadaceae bacterium]|nr:PstS family phosphate ABC transporter substrate-binding protein [Desulfuromonadaceae bacterium]MDD2848866.1 PstS family phosphate ABC transporter substrate-binding protein [Desulfuromonadaceae bacterium]MDD4132177.1 PstS family phosphate ABC transporter substrate-binding protein [Desulfuromonadaceae bacterium]